MKSKKIAFVIFIIGYLMLGNNGIQAMTVIDNVSYPSTIQVGDSFDVDVVFEYRYALDCLYGDYIWLYYDYGPNPVTSAFTLNIEKTIIEIRPHIVTITVDTSDMNDLVADDIFRFRIQYIKGSERTDGTGGLYDMGIGHSANFDIGVELEDPVDPNATALYFMPIALIGLAIIYMKKHR